MATLRSQGRASSTSRPRITPAMPRPPSHSKAPPQSRPTQGPTSQTCPTSADMRTNSNDVYPSVTPLTTTRTYAQTAAASSSRSSSSSDSSSKSIAAGRVRDHNNNGGAFVGPDGPDAATFYDSAQTTATATTTAAAAAAAADAAAAAAAAAVSTLMPATLEQILGVIGTKCEESLSGFRDIRENIVQIMWGGAEEINKLKKERHESFESVKRLQSDLAHERDVNSRLLRENSKLELENHTVAIQLDNIKSQHNTCGGVINGLRRDMAMLIDQQSQLEAASTPQVVEDLPKVADETIRERWMELVLAIRKFASQHLAWDYKAALDHGDGSSPNANASGSDGDGDGAGARAASDSRETMRGGLDLIFSEASALKGDDPKKRDRVLDRLSRLVLEAHLWRLLDVLVFGNKAGLWGGPPGELFSQLCHMLPPNSCANFEALQRLINWRVNGAAIIDQSLGIDVQRVPAVVSSMIYMHLGQFVVGNHDQDRCVQRLAAIVKSAVELYAIFAKSRAILEVCWPNTWPERAALLEPTSGEGSQKNGCVGDGAGEEEEDDDDQAHVLYMCRGEPRFLVVSPALTKRGTADGDRYQEQIILVQARVVA